MNLSTYIFGTLGNRYSQYPNDYTQSIFQRIYTHSSAPTQIAIHREGNLIYYVYIRKIQAGKYIGLCVALNSVMLTDFNEMFSIFENMITSLVIKGVILQFDKKGDIIFKADKLSVDLLEVSCVTDNLRDEFKKLKSTSKALPPISYGISQNKEITFSDSDDINDIIKASVSYDYTYIFKRQNYESQSFASYRDVLSKISEENLSLKKKIDELQEENTKILRQKKQVTKVVLLIVVIIVCGIGLFLLNGSLDETKNELSISKNKISKLTTNVANLNDSLKAVRNSLNITCKERDRVQQKIEELKNKVGESMPILISDIQIANTNYNGDIETNYGETIYSSSTMYLKPKITYIGVKTDENINLNVKFYTPSGLSTGSNSPYGYSYSSSMYVSSGENTYSLSSWGGETRGHWKSGQYRFEIWYGDVCLKSKSFTVF